MPGADPITAAANLGTAIAGIVDKFVPDKDQAAKLAADLQTKLLDVVQTETAGQSAANAAEAASPSIFVSGWRPFVGWVCGFAYAWNFVIGPLFGWLYTVITHNPAPVLALPADALNVLLFGLLGLGGLRSFEKFKGVAS